MSAPIPPLTSWQGPVFLLNSRLGLFSAAPEGLHPPGHSFFRSYGVRLPSSLTRVLSFTWGHRPPPTGVGLRYGRPSALPRGFSGQCRPSPVALGLPSASPFPPLSAGGDLPPPASLESGTHHVQWARRALLSGSPRRLKRPKDGTGLLTRCPSPAAFALGLGPTNPTRNDLP